MVRASLSTPVVQHALAAQVTGSPLVEQAAPEMINARISQAAHLDRHFTG
jgi:hypothetical protein